MKTRKMYFLMMCLLFTGAVMQAQSLPEAYSGKKLPTAEGWQEMKFHAGLLWEQEAKDLATDPSLLSAVATTALKLQVPDGKYAQYGWGKGNTGFSAEAGFTVEFRAKVVNAAPGAFSVYGFDAAGKGFRLELSNSLLTEHSNTVETATTLSTESTTDDFHTYRVAVVPGGSVHIWRDNVKVGELPMQTVKGDNWIKDGGFESGATAASLGYRNDGTRGSVIVSNNPAHVHSGQYGLFFNRGRHVSNFIPLKPGAEYAFGFWGKNINYPTDAWRDLNGLFFPADAKFMYGVVNKNDPNWIRYGAGGATGGAVQRFLLESPTNPDSNNNQTAYDEFLLTEQIRPSRIPANAVNLFPNGDFENPAFNAYFPAGDSRNDPLLVSNAEDNQAPDWHPFWGARVRLQYQRQADNDEAGIYFSKSGKYSLRYFNCFGNDTQYGVDKDKSYNDGRGYNCNLNANLELQAGKKYTFNFSYHFAKWAGDHLILVIKNGEEELLRGTINNAAFPYWQNALITFTTTAQNHNLRILTERDGSSPGVLYMDDFFLFEGEPLPEYDNTYLFFGKPAGTDGVDVEIQSVAYDNTGAYTPDGTLLVSAYEKKTAPLMSPWGEALDANEPIMNEYPRPQMERANWVNLNGIWDFTRKTRAGLGAYTPGGVYRQQILVPYPVESALSGVMDKDYTNRDKIYEYKRTFTVAPADAGKQIILHFGAVDWAACVFVNGTKVGGHTGGFDPFSFDITGALKASGEQELVVQIYDPTKAGQPRGKQDPNPGGIWYTPSSGIWQTVWYEAVNTDHINKLSLTPDVDNSAIRIAVDAPAGTTAEVTILDGTTVVKTVTIPVGQETAIALSSPKLWSPDSPFLYKLDITLKKDGNAVDEVKSYFGMRKIEVKQIRNKPYMFLNDKPTFHYGVLDQGYWPDGLHTAPTYEALRFDIEKVKELGMNLIRKHIKVEPARWYYYCDSIGIMVWQDMPTAADYYDPMGDDNWVKQTFYSESERIIKSLMNHPSIVVWVPYNEGWAQFDYNVEHTRNGVELIQRLDTTRLINPASGWTNFELGDIIDRHNYSEPALHNNPYNRRASVCGETGGYGWAIAGHIWGKVNNPYANIASTEEFAERFRSFNKTAYALTTGGINAIVYTQISDVEEEVNGFYTYDRKICKLDGEPKAELMRGIEQMKTQTLLLDYVLPIAPVGYSIWKYITGSRTFTVPAGWNTRVDYDDSNWQEGLAGFGNDNPPGSKIRTVWDNSTIYLRKIAHIKNLTDTEKAALKLAVYYDEDFELYINGVLAASHDKWSTSYELFEISPAAKAAIKYGEDNLIAIHVKQTGGGQYIDAGLVIAQEVPLDYETTATVPAFKEIRTVQELDDMRNDLDGFYELRADIDLSGYSFEPVGKPENPFRGYLRGNGHAISGMDARRTNGNMQGLFGYASGAYFTDLEIVKPHLIGNADVGALLGKGVGVTIERVLVTEPSISGYDRVGAIAGGTDGEGGASYIKDCYVTDGAVASSRYQAGGILGVAQNTRIENVYYTGTVEATTGSPDYNAGGIVAVNENAQNMMSGVASLATSVRGGTTSEFIARGALLVRVMERCYTYPDMKLSAYANPGNTGLGRATAEQKKTLADFRKRDTYLDMGWDFEHIWTIDEDNAFPVFQYKKTGIQPVYPLHSNDLKVYKSGEKLVLKTTHPASVWIYTVSGSLVRRLDVKTSETVTLPHGIYVVKSVSNGEAKAEKVLN